MCRIKAILTERMQIIMLVAALFLLSCPVEGFAQEAAKDPVAQLGTGELLGKAADLLAKKFYEESMPFLTEYVTRMSTNSNERVQMTVQEVRLKLAKIMVQLERSDEAVSGLEQYLSYTPVYRWREAHRLLASTQYKSGNYEACIWAVTNGLAGSPQATGPAGGVTNYAALSPTEMGGLTDRQLKRYEQYAAEAGQDPFGVAMDPAKTDPQYTPEEMVLMNLLLAESYAGLEQWKESVEPYQYVVAHDTDEDRRGYAIMQLVSALIKQREFDKASGFVRELYQTDARYNIRVNMALMSTASAFFNGGDYDSSLMLYRMVLPRGQLVAHQVTRMNALRTAAGLPDVRMTLVTNETGRVQTMFGESRGATLQPKVAQARPQAAAGKPDELIEMEERLATLMSLPPYENDVMYRTAQVYASAGRPWEAMMLFDAVIKLDPDGELGRQAFCEMLQVMVDPLKDFSQVEQRGLAFLKQVRDGAPPRQVAYTLTGMYLQQDRMRAIKDILPPIKGFVPSSDRLIRKYECELYYMQAIADMMMLNYEQAEAGFRTVLADFPASHQEDNLSYWHAMSLLFLQRYDEAFGKFDDYLKRFPNGNWVDAASFRSGICLFGAGRYDEAKIRFTHVIETWPNSAVYPDACSLRGDLFGSQGLLDEAVRDYREALRAARKIEQATYAVFQMTSVFEAEKRYVEIIDAVNAYLKQYGEAADITKAVYWIGKTRLQQGLVNEAVAEYLNAIITYGYDVERDGVDLIISDLVQTALRRLDNAQRRQLVEKIAFALSDSKNLALTLRLRVLQARLNHSEKELGQALLRESINLTQAPPPVLAEICDASFELKDYSRAEEILKMFRTRFEDSEFTGAAYKLRAFGLYASGELDEAMKIIEQAQAAYGTADDMVWAQMMKGRILLTQGRLDKAREAFIGTLNVRSWRGEPYAEATYNLGRVEEAAGNPRKAFGWYQRTYFQYKGYASGYWAAEAYLASARCLQALGLENDRRNTFRAMLFDSYVNSLPQAETVRRELGSEETAEIKTMLDAGVRTNLTIKIEGGGDR